MPITPRGTGYEATVNSKHLPNGRLRKLFATQAEAKSWELGVKAKIAAGETITTDGKTSTGAPATLKQLFDMTQRKYWKGTPGETAAMINARGVMKVLGENLHPSRITQQSLDELTFQCEAAGLSDSTINKRLSALSKALSFAVERDWIVKRPKFEFKRTDNGRVRFLSDQEEAEALAYFHHIDQAWMADFCTIALDTGMRVSEILGIEKRDINVNLISVWKNKSNRPRSIPMTRRVQEVIERRGKLSFGKLFERYTISMVGHYWDRMRHHQGLMKDSQFVPHAMRHTFCSRLVQRGVPIVTIKELAGHSSIQVTMRYAHLCPHNLASAIDLLQNGAPETTRDNDLQVSPPPHHGGESVVDTTIDAMLGRETLDPSTRYGAVSPAQGT